MQYLDLYAWICFISVLFLFFLSNDLYKLTQKTNKNKTWNIYKTEQQNHWTLCAISKCNKVIKRQKKL